MLTHARRSILLFALPLALLVGAGSRFVGHRPFPLESTPEGAYVRIALMVAERRPRDAFPYLETEAQWASFTIREMRKKACERVRESYPPAEATPLLETWREEAEAPDGPDVFVHLASRRGWIRRLERDLSGVAHVEVQGDRATVITARATRYPFRRRDNGLWGLTIFTAELEAEAERATRDLEVVDHAAADYERAGKR
jgi:hypothetical protein